MTDREQVIDILTEHLDLCKELLSTGLHTKDEGERLINALTYAIESMKVDLTYDLLYEKVESDREQEPCEDCISRQAAIDALGECPMNWTDSEAEITAERDWIDAVNMLKSLPSVNPQPKTEQEPSDDCISRQDVKELFQEACEMEMYDFLGIDDMPSVTPQPKTDVLDKIYTDIQRLRGCSCSCSDGIIDDIEDIIDKYKTVSEDEQCK